MLDLGIPTELDRQVERLWHSLPSRTRLPWSDEKYLSTAGPAPVRYDSRRQFHRFHLRGIAVLWCGSGTHAIYTKDVSRMGLAFYSPIQLFPLQIVKVILPNQDSYTLRVVRCRRIQVACYDCGTRFDSSADTSDAPLFSACETGD